MKNKLILIGFILLIVLISSSALMAIPTPCGDIGDCTICLGRCDGTDCLDCGDCIQENCQAAIPINSGLIYLIIMVVGLVAKKVVGNKRE